MRNLVSILGSRKFGILDEKRPVIYHGKITRLRLYLKAINFNKKPLLYQLMWCYSIYFSTIDCTVSLHNKKKKNIHTLQFGKNLYIKNYILIMLCERVNSLGIYSLIHIYFFLHIHFAFILAKLALALRNKII